MKRILLASVISGACMASYASKYVIVLDSKTNEYTKVSYDIVYEVSEWEDYGAIYGCGTPTPLTSDVFEEVNFEQTETCSQDQNKYKETYKVSQTTGEKTFVSKEVEETQTISITQSAGFVQGSYKAKSCLDILNHGGEQTDGHYDITPKNNEINVYCNMTDGGYTEYKMSGAYQFTRDVEAACEANDLQLFVPRTQTQLTKAVLRHTTDYLYLMGIYPNYKTAKCDTVYLNSDSCHNWSPKDNGKFFVYNYPISYPHNGGGVGILPEPNGDNDTDASMRYVFDNTTGKVISFNDIENSNSSTIGGYQTNKWLCSAKDEVTL